MEEIKNFFEGLQNDINNSKTDKNLRFLAKKAKKYTNMYLASPIAKTYKKVVSVYYRKALKSITHKAKSI